LKSFNVLGILLL